MSSRPSLQLFESRTPSPAVSKTIPAKGRPCYPSGSAFVHFGGEACAGRVAAGRGAGARCAELTGHGVRGVGRARERTRRAGWARCGGALARIKAWGLGAARLLYELTLRGFAWAKTPPIYGILAPERSSFSVNGFAILFMNNHKYITDMRKQLSGGYNVNNEHISTLKRYSNDLDTRDKRKERRTLHD